MSPNGKPTQLDAVSKAIIEQLQSDGRRSYAEIGNKEIRGIPGVRSTETFVYLKLQKQFYNWGTR